ncbi:MAG TPA: hypothetical protein PLA71_00600 [Saccharofermentans sp.]|nr:hypothetical protein [Saccharofermentans sp.]
MDFEHKLLQEKVYSIERGIVVDNYDPEFLGRVKIFVFGVYPEIWKTEPAKLPWAEPVMSLFGGSWKNDRLESTTDLNQETGISSVPHTSMVTPGDGAQVWVFFESADPNYPKYFASCQSGPGWASQHRYQHVIKTDNVKIVVDEEPTHEQSTQQFTTYNEECTELSKQNHTKENVPTRVDIQIWGAPGIALNLQILGDVNLKVEGDVYEHIVGNKHETHIGNLYRKHVGDVQIIQDGNYVEEQTGDRTFLNKGNNLETITKNKTSFVKGNVDHFYTGNYHQNTKGDKTEIVEKNKFERVSKVSKEDVFEDKKITVLNNLTSVSKVFYASAKEGATVYTEGGKLAMNTIAGIYEQSAPIVNTFSQITNHNAIAIFNNQNGAIVPPPVMPSTIAFPSPAAVFEEAAETKKEEIATTIAEDLSAMEDRYDKLEEEAIEGELPDILEEAEELAEDLDADVEASEASPYSEDTNEELTGSLEETIEDLELDEELGGILTENLEESTTENVLVLRDASATEARTFNTKKVMANGEFSDITNLISSNQKKLLGASGSQTSIPPEATILATSALNTDLSSILSDGVSMDDVVAAGPDILADSNLAANLPGSEMLNQAGIGDVSDLAKQLGASGSIEGLIQKFKFDSFDSIDLDVTSAMNNAIDKHVTKENFMKLADRAVAANPDSNVKMVYAAMKPGLEEQLSKTNNFDISSVGGMVNSQLNQTKTNLIQAEELKNKIFQLQATNIASVNVGSVMDAVNMDEMKNLIQTTDITQMANLSLLSDLPTNLESMFQSEFLKTAKSMYESGTLGDISYNQLLQEGMNVGKIVGEQMPNKMNLSADSKKLMETTKSMQMKNNQIKDVMKNGKLGNTGPLKPTLNKATSTIFSKAKG